MAKITTITNPLTGQPAQVDQLDHTAQQIDDAVGRALPGGYYDKWVSQLPGQNLLDNSVFIDGCLVDQRQGRVVKPNTTYYSDNQLTTAAGTTSAYVTAYRYATGTASGVSYASFKLTDSDTAPTYYAARENVVRGYANFTNNSVYSIDRWILKFGYVIVNDGYITWGNNRANGACQYMQIIPISVLPGKRLSYSILTTNGVYTNTVIAPSVGNYIQSTVNIEGITFSVRVYCNDNGTAELVLRRDSTIFSLNLVGVKFELGSQQTLAHQDSSGNWVLNEIPNYAEELVKCQRYFQRIIVPTSTTFTPMKDNLLFYQCDLPVQMRTEPSVTCGTFFIVNASNDSAVFSENFVTPTKQSASVNSVIISANKSQSNPVPAGKSGGAYVGSYYNDPGTRIIDCTADL